MASDKGETNLNAKNAAIQGSLKTDNKTEQRRAGPCSDRFKSKFTVGVGKEWDLSVSTEIEGEGKRAISTLAKVIYLFGFVAILGFAAYIITILN